jgi:hypothetical protein
VETPEGFTRGEIKYGLTSVGVVVYPGRTAGPSTALRSVEKHFQQRTTVTADLSTTLLRSSGRDDKGEGGASIEGGCRTEAIFYHLGRAEGP